MAQTETADFLSNLLKATTNNATIPSSWSITLNPEGNQFILRGQCPEQGAFCDCHKLAGRQLYDPPCLCILDRATLVDRLLAKHEHYVSHHTCELDPSFTVVVYAVAPQFLAPCAAIVKAQKEQAEAQSPTEGYAKYLQIQLYMAMEKLEDAMNDILREYLPPVLQDGIDNMLNTLPSTIHGTTRRLSWRMLLSGFPIGVNFPDLRGLVNYAGAAHHKFVWSCSRTMKQSTALISPDKIHFIRSGVDQVNSYATGEFNVVQLHAVVNLLLTHIALP